MSEDKKFILKLFLFVQLIPFAGWFLGSFFLPLRPDFIGRKLGSELEGRPLLWSRANFDGFHYVSIARSGYGYLQQAFFPLYVKLIRFIQPVLKNFIFTGIFISSIGFLGCLWLMPRLLEQEGIKKAVVKKLLLFLVLFPTSFYFVSVYTESIFLFLVLLTFWFAGKKQWIKAGLIAGLASHTRLVGIFLLPAVLYEYYETETKRSMKKRLKAAKQNFIQKLNCKYFKHVFKSRWPHFKNFLLITSLSSLGLFSYMMYLKKTVGDYLYFMTAQPEFGAKRTIGKVIMLYQVFWRYIKMIFTVDPTSHIYFIVWLELLVSVLFLVLIFLGWFKYKIKKSWMIFATLVFVLPSITGTFSSMPRYVLVCFPCFLVLAKMKLPKWIYWLSGGLLLICASLFFRGYWVA